MDNFMVSSRYVDLTTNMLEWRYRGGFAVLSFAEPSAAHDFCRNEISMADSPLQKTAKTASMSGSNPCTNTATRLTSRKKQRNPSWSRQRCSPQPGQPRPDLAGPPLLLSTRGHRHPQMRMLRSASGPYLP